MGKMKKVILFYNPLSGYGMIKNNLDNIIGRYQDAGKRIVPIRAYGESGLSEYLAELNPRTYKEQYSQILAAGGDGTVNVCIDAMVRNNIDLPLGILPAGTANDMAYYFELSDDIDEMLDTVLSGYYETADVGAANGRYFLNVAAIGQIIDVLQKTDGALKNSIGMLAYYITGLRSVSDLKPVHVRLTAPGKTYEEDMYFMAVMNGRSAYGFKQMSPGSVINDGKLNVILFRSTNVASLSRIFIKMMSGAHLENRNVLTFTTDRLRVESDCDMATDLDGERGTKLPVDFSVLHNRLRICTAKKKNGEKNE